jgi:hypothetical protein
MSSKYPNRNTSDIYTGPSVPEMVASHTLAKEIITRHNDECPILDDNEIALLQQFIVHPDQAQSILAARGLADEPGDEPDAKVWASGSLVAAVMKRHGTDKPFLTDDEIVALREWFESGEASIN